VVEVVIALSYWKKEPKIRSHGISGISRKDAEEDAKTQKIFDD
jgi:hypothetical protein